MKILDSIDNTISIRFTYLTKIFSLFDHAEKRQFIWVLIVAFCMASFQAVGVASVLPFVNMLLEPDSIMHSRYLGWLYTTLGFSDKNSFILMLGFLILFIIVTGNFISAVSTWIKMRFVFRNNHNLATKLLKKYLSLPYIFFLNNNTANLGKNILSEVNTLTFGILISFLEIVVKGIIVILILGMLLYVDFYVSMFALMLLGGSYAFIYYLLRKRLQRRGEERLSANQGRFETAYTALGGIKDIKILGREQFFIDRFQKHSKRHSELQAWHAVLENVPRYLLETIAFGGIIVLILSLLFMKGNINETIPLVTLFAFAGYRLMPALQNIFQAFTNMKFDQAVLDKIYIDMHEIDSLSMKDIHFNGELPDPLPFHNEIKISSITYSYPYTSETVLRNISFEVKRNASIAIVGSTGSGKTTLVDIILGLLTPRQGNIFVDGTEVTENNVRNWQRNLGYVPQQIFLSDDTITRNIAFGIPDNMINRKSLETAAQIANIHDFIINELPKGYDTIVGERGIRLSGGERQRIGIARALYHNPEILVLDEATSSLDGITEDAVLQAIDNAAKLKTLIIIAHRLTTVMNCDVIYLIQNGNLIASGTYAELISTNVQFRAMAKTIN
jgi:ATP-binding cassette, subfamily B, bacterial PglK